MKKECTPLNDCVLVYREKNTKDEVEVGDTKLFIDTSWYEYDHVIQHAIVRHVPKRISSYFKTEMELIPGDKVYCHHFVADEKNMIEIYEEKLSKLNYGQLYARVRDNKVHMLADWVLVDIVKDKEEELTTETGIWLKTEEEKKALTKEERMEIWETWASRQIDEFNKKPSLVMAFFCTQHLTKASVCVVLVTM